MRADEMKVCGRLDRSDVRTQQRRRSGFEHRCDRDGRFPAVPYERQRSVRGLTLAGGARFGDAPVNPLEHFAGMPDLFVEALCGIINRDGLKKDFRQAHPPCG